ncbi:MAG: alkyl sulfatase dimerization domain-containing protein [Hyphomicrobiaceae bacterium]
MFKYLHDQTVRLMNKGYASAEIAEELKVPPGLANNWPTREYYGTISHNAKAVYQRYLGWYDGNPANLAPLPPVERACKMVAYMGGADAILERAAKDFEQGEYRWVADAMNLVVQSDPANTRARTLGADALEQLGYQTESATWRNSYLLGAHELRNGTPTGASKAMVSPDVVRALTAALMFDYMATNLDGPRADGKHVVVNWSLTDTGERYALNLQNAALTCIEDWHNPQAHVAVALDKSALGALVTGQLTVDEAQSSGRIAIEGPRAVLEDLFALVDRTTSTFALIEPRKP